ncbi:hypothetical protein H5410_045618, partial [Solanum commersonii]
MDLIAKLSRCLGREVDTLKGTLRHFSLIPPGGGGILTHYLASVASWIKGSLHLPFFEINYLIIEVKFTEFGKLYKAVDALEKGLKDTYTTTVIDDLTQDPSRKAGATTTHTNEQPTQEKTNETGSCTGQRGKDVYFDLPSANAIFMHLQLPQNETCSMLYFLDSPGISALLHLGKKIHDLALDPQLDHSQGQDEGHLRKVVGIAATCALPLGDITTK